MAETKVLVKLTGVPASVLSKLVEKGYYSTKSEALRAGVVRLGEEFGIVSPTEEAWMRLQSEIRKTGRRPAAGRVLRSSSASIPGLRVVFDTSLIVIGLTINPSNSRLALDLARAGAFRELGIPELVLKETSTVLERLYGRRAVPAARSFLLRIGTLIP
jgi:Arc/MetJ-type ribon-helix-helix transcriptional regulator